MLRKLVTLNAGVAELADAQDLKSCGTYTPVPVRFRSPALISEYEVEFAGRQCSARNARFAGRQCSARNAHLRKQSLLGVR